MPHALYMLTSIVVDATTIGYVKYDVIDVVMSYALDMLTTNVIYLLMSHSLDMLIQCHRFVNVTSIRYINK